MSVKTSRRFKGRTALGLLGGVALALSFAALPAAAEETGTPDGVQAAAEAPTVEEPIAELLTDVPPEEPTSDPEPESEPQFAEVTPEPQNTTPEEESFSAPDEGDHESAGEAVEQETMSRRSAVAAGVTGTPEEGWGSHQMTLAASVAPEEVTLSQEGNEFKTTVAATVTLGTYLDLGSGEMQTPVNQFVTCGEANGLSVSPVPNLYYFTLTTQNPTKTQTLDFTLSTDTDITAALSCTFTARIYDSIEEKYLEKEAAFTVLPAGSSDPTVIADSLTQNPGSMQNTCPATTVDLSVSGSVLNVGNSDRRVYGQLTYNGDGVDGKTAEAAVGENGNFTLDIAQVQLRGKDPSLFSLNLWLTDPTGIYPGPTVKMPLQFGFQDCDPSGTAAFTPEVAALSSQRGDPTYSGPTTAWSTLSGQITFPGLSGTRTFSYSVPGAASGSESGTLEVQFVDGEGTFTKDIEFDKPGTFTATVTYGSMAPEGAIIIGDDDPLGAQYVGQGEYNSPVNVASTNITVREGLISAAWTTKAVTNVCPATTASATVSGNVYSADGLTLFANLWTEDESLQGEVALQHKKVPVENGKFTATFDDVAAGKYYVVLFLADGEKLVDDAMVDGLVVTQTDCSSGGGESDNGNNGKSDEKGSGKSDASGDKTSGGSAAKSDRASLAKTGSDIGVPLALGALLTAGGLILTRRKA